MAAATATATGVAGYNAHMPTEAVKAWQGAGRDAASGADPRRWRLSYAILAPHSHHLQS